MPCPLRQPAGHRRRSTRGCARSSTGTSIPRPARRSGSTSRRRRDGIRAARSRRFADLQRFGEFQDEWLRGGPVQRWIPKGLDGQADLRVRDRRHDRHPEDAHRVAKTSASTTSCSARRCPTSTFPKGSNWLMLGPSGPRRLRLAVEHLAQFRGGICFCVDLDPRWVIKLIKKGWSEHLQAYKDHVIDQAVTILQAGHDIRCMFTTPKLLEVARAAARGDGDDDPEDGDHRHLLRRHRVHAAVEPLRARGAARRRLHDADLRQHADGPGGERAERPAQRLQDHLLRAAAARRRRGRRLRRPEQGRRRTARPAA